ncbi:hypothetical protein [Ectobacillus ponti]|uniref:Uncharacterized protein n=1 Tax=Ectobacillus ponti TaxID=2961894 RepID=A0AA42BQ97_9BACI|nr:hypothetical protein [Ectobacillus ponti]MCP8969176.1 hypothetical protein [Ectobacillus ponti]
MQEAVVFLVCFAALSAAALALIVHCRERSLVCVCSTRQYQKYFTAVGRLEEAGIPHITKAANLPGSTAAPAEHVQQYTLLVAKKHEQEARRLLCQLGK